MTLAEYIFYSKKNYEEFAKECNISKPSVWRLVHGINRPSSANCERILEVTGGLVSLEELLYPGKFISENEKKIKEFEAKKLEKAMEEQKKQEEQNVASKS